jgi:TRAP-type C4-dicarboxylate transport system permease small subunit
MNRLIHYFFKLLELLVVILMVAMVAMREGGHLGVDTLVKHLSRGGKKFCLFLSESLMLYCNGLFLLGTWKMHDLQVTNVSPVAGLSMIWVFGIGYVVSLVMGIMNIRVLYRLLSGRITEAELIQVVEAEGLADVEKTLQTAKA